MGSQWTKKTNKAQRGSTKGKINYKVSYLAYVAYNKEGLNHVHACMCQYDLEENQGKFLTNKSLEEYLTWKNNEIDMDLSV